ncbi:MAG: mechanosensitive ion channel family protein [Cloacibacillus sp.]
MNVNLEGIPAMLQKVTFASLLPALIYLVAGVVIIRLLMSAASKALARSSVEKTLHKFLLTIVRLVLYFVLFMTVAGALGIQITSFVAILSVAGLALSLSLQGVLANLSSGIMLLSVKPFKVGDYVEVGGVSGTVDEIGFIYTRVSTVDNRLIFIPNSEVSSSKITNFTSETKRRVDFLFKASYDSPAEAVKAAVMDAAARFPQIMAEPAPFVRVSAYGESAVEYAARFWCATGDYWDIYHGIMEALPAEYKKHGVSMSYPHLNVHVTRNESDDN